MMTKEQEIEMYSKSYLYAFNKDRSFFHENNSSVIYAFLTESFWGDGLELRLKLLVNLLSMDSSVCPKNRRKELAKKSKELNDCLIKLQNITY